MLNMIFLIVSIEESHQKGGSISSCSFKIQAFAFAGKFFDKSIIVIVNFMEIKIYNVKSMVLKVTLLKDVTNLLAFQKILNLEIMTIKFLISLCLEMFLY